MTRLWRDQGKVQQAHDLLAPVYGWFTEAFDTRSKGGRRRCWRSWQRSKWPIASWRLRPMKLYNHAHAPNPRRRYKVNLSTRVRRSVFAIVCDQAPASMMGRAP